MSFLIVQKMETADQAPGAAGDFAIGNLVYVSGTKKGKIAFLGDTRFAAGEWAGVVLDEPVGKNDGSVNGVRYFTCEPMHGIFCKLEKLSPCLEAENFSPPEGAQAASPAQNGYPAAANSGDQISNVPAANISGKLHQPSVHPGTSTGMEKNLLVVNARCIYGGRAFYQRFQRISDFDTSSTFRSPKCRRR